MPTDNLSPPSQNALGFSVNIEFGKIDGNIEKRNAILEAFITEAIEKRGLYFGGGGTSSWSGYVESPTRNCTDEDRHAVESWLRNQEDVSEFQIGSIVDLEKADPLGEPHKNKAFSRLALIKTSILVLCVSLIQIPVTIGAWIGAMYLGNGMFGNSGAYSVYFQTFCTIIAVIAYHALLRYLFEWRYRDLIIAFCVGIITTAIVATYIYYLVLSSFV